MGDRTSDESPRIAAISVGSSAPRSISPNEGVLSEGVEAAVGEGGGTSSSRSKSGSSPSAKDGVTDSLRRRRRVFLFPPDAESAVEEFSMECDSGAIVVRNVVLGNAFVKASVDCVMIEMAKNAIAAMAVNDFELCMLLARGVEPFLKMSCKKNLRP